MIDTQLKRGMLEMCVLSAACRGESYGYKMIRDLNECVVISESTLYPILKRLENAGCLEVEASEHNGRLRKVYRVTETGVERLSDFVSSWHEVTDMFTFIKGGLPQ